MCLAQSQGMGWICEHCSAPFEGSAYRVTSEESGDILLNMIVCHACCIEAQELGLHNEEISLQSSVNASGDTKRDVSG